MEKIAFMFRRILLDCWGNRIWRMKLVKEFCIICETRIRVLTAQSWTGSKRISGETKELFIIYNCATETFRNETPLTDTTTVVIRITKQQYTVGE